MALIIKTPPAVEPVSLAEAKLHLRIDSGTLSDNLALLTSIAPRSHVIAAAYSLLGTAVEVSGYDAVVYLIAGTNGDEGTVDVKLKESEDGTTWSDVPSGAFTQVTEATDNAVQEKAYTRSYRYIRAVATVGTAACEFSVAVMRKSGPTTEDDLLSGLIAAARQDCELFQNRSYITQTWELWLDRWPGNNFIELPRPPLQGVDSITYYDVNDIEYSVEEYMWFVDTKNEPGFVVLNHGYSWPSVQLRPANGICFTFVAGYGDAGSDVPQNIVRAMLLLIGHLYEHREDVITGTISAQMPMGSQHLLWKERIF